MPTCAVHDRSRLGYCRGKESHRSLYRRSFRLGIGACGRVDSASHALCFAPGLCAAQARHRDTWRRHGALGVGDAAGQRRRESDHGAVRQAACHLRARRRAVGCAQPEHEETNKHTHTRVSASESSAVPRYSRGRSPVSRPSFVALVRMERAHTRGNPAKRRPGNRTRWGRGLRPRGERDLEA